MGEMYFNLKNGREEIFTESKSVCTVLINGLRVGGLIDEATRRHLAVEAR